jgi:uncharacterized protein (DUF1778 family)
MQTTANISLRIPSDQARLLKRVAKRHGVKLATFVREAALRVAAECDVRDNQLEDAAKTVAQGATWGRMMAGLPPHGTGPQ